MTMRTTHWVVVLLLVAGRAAAQDTTVDATRRDELLRQTIEARFTGRVVEELGLNLEQATKFTGTTLEYADKRRSLQLRERRLRQALAGQLRPGVAADQDSVQKLTDALLDVKEDYVKIARDELRAMGYLTPLQRAQFFAMRERLLERVQQFQAQRQEQGRAQPGRRLRP
jgi:hypothetical protein